MEEEPHLNFRTKDPGCVRYGNFINYYSFNPAENRIQLLPPELWQQERAATSPYTVLDVGCNSGALTQLLYEFLRKHTSREVHVLGLDIDPILIQRADEENKFPDRVSYKWLNVMNDENEAVRGFLQGFGVDRFDAVFCFSVTMWIHLNEGDEGLKRFLSKCKSLSRLLVIEPQPWKCYQTAVKRLKKSNEMFPEFKLLQWRSTVEADIQQYLEEELRQRKVYETEPTKWRRKICFYQDSSSQ